MLAIYDNNGNLINETSNKAAIVGSLYCLEVTIPEGKLLDHIDVSTTTHLPVLVDEPKTPTEMSIESIKKTVPKLLDMDIKYAKRIDTLENQVAGFTTDINQIKLQLKNLQG